MTNTFRDPPAADAWHASPDALARYAAGAVDAVTAWSVEAHLTTCDRCRAVLAEQMDAERLARNRAVLVVRAATPTDGWAHRLACRCGVPDHLLRLLAATPSLRASWLLSVLGVLAVVTGETAVAAALSGTRRVDTFGREHLLAPFVLVSPLLVLASVAAAFLPMFDPAYQLAVAAPFSRGRLLMVRTLAALGAAVVPVVCAGFVVPGPRWLPAALLVPSLALCALALAAATITRPTVAATGVGLLWAAPILVVTQTHTALTVVDWHAQSICAVVLLVAAVLVVLRRDRFDLGWNT